MGLFSAIGSLCSAVGGAIKGTVGFVGKVAKKIIEYDIDITSAAINWIKENILNIEDTPTYKPEVATVDETKKINELLEKCIESYKPKAEEYDKIAEGIIVDQSERLIGQLIKVNEITGEKIIDDFVFEMFENYLKSIKKNLDKIYSKQISNVFSLNNNKLLDILKLDKGNEKKDKLSELAVNSIINANRELLGKSSEYIKEQQKFIDSKLGTYMETSKNNLIVAESETTKILKDINKDKEYRLNLERRYQDLLDDLELLGRIMQGEKC